MNLTVRAALLGNEYRVSGPVEIQIAEGRIAAIVPACRDVPNHLAMPTLADAHNHARPLSATSFGGGGKPLETWLPGLAVIPPVDPYTAAAASFGRSLSGGCTAVMVHLTRPMGGMPLADEAREIARAAADVGLSIGFAVSLRDRNPLVYGDHGDLVAALPEAARSALAGTLLRQPPNAEEQLDLVDTVASAVADQHTPIDVQYGPTGVQWCSDELLSGIARRSAATGRRVHMHFLETKPQRDWADATFPNGILANLDRIGLLSPRLTLAHCVWARPEELAAIARSGTRVAVNASSNLQLFSGVAAVGAMRAAGVQVAMGLDGCALDEDDDALREMRLLHLLNHAPGFDPGGLTPETALVAACVTGRATLGLNSGGVLAPGQPADLMLLDLDQLDRDAIMEVSPLDYLFARATRAHIVAAYAGGHEVLRDGAPTGIDLPSTEERLRGQFRAAMPDTAAFRGAWPEIEAAIDAHYRGCC
ncbi:MAG: amidohydrolase family protein [Pseudomonadota bacterium]